MAPTVARFSRHPAAAEPGDVRLRPEPLRGGPGADLISADELSDRLRRLAATIARLERLPARAGDSRSPRPHEAADHWTPAIGEHDDAVPDLYGELDPVIWRAFNAVAAGLDKLAASAIALSEHTHDPPTRDEIAACAEIGALMRSLLERALALAGATAPPKAAARS